MRFRKTWWGSWWRLGELCEIPRCLLWRGLRRRCPMYNVSCILSSLINVSIFHITWLDTFWTDLVCKKYLALGLAYNSCSLDVNAHKVGFLSSSNLTLPPHYHTFTLMVCLTIISPPARKITDAREGKRKWWYSRFTIIKRKSFWFSNLGITLIIVAEILAAPSKFPSLTLLIKWPFYTIWKTHY